MGVFIFLSPLSMSFAIDRVEAARRLSVSTRTVDRYIQAERIRTKRIGKKMFLNEDDVETIRMSEPSRDEEEYVVLFDEEDRKDDEVELIHKKREVATPAWHGPDFVQLYQESQGLIAKKDDIIQDLAYRLGKSEAELKNSIPLVEYKKATFLLESAKTKGEEDKGTLSTKLESLEKEITKRNSAILWLAILFVLVLAFAVVFFLYTKLSLG